MKKEVIVLSLGGSLIIPDNIDVKYLKEFRKTILENTRRYKFIIVCGGGSIARKYISALREIGMNELFQSFAGISATRMNARFMSYFFKQDQERGIPHKMEELKKYAKKFDVVFCGALEYKPHQTSDSTSAQIAKEFKTIFINLTDVAGLHDKNPKKHKDAKFIPRISWKDFHKMATKEKFKPGQHFVLDQTASTIIMKEKITTYILGKDMKQLNALLEHKKFKGTIIGDF
ncbi:MAG: UMP kinase [Candidatus Nanoarchaeia archaeon]|nr:UMP kinase [Candidatus Nanoarchaeia archaeon]MDD5357901.1 UMP kinase [Candidatus Nanoarchaeia archaeon]MDD5588820.1 UMP kinase [Candidatus Nanoarchaeia archaeon]